MTTQDTLLKLQPYPVERYDSLDLNRLTVYVIDLLAEMNIPTTIENISVACFRLFPHKFHMIDYPQFPDLARANRALLQLRPKYRGWATGSVKRGFQLNSKGAEIVRQIKLQLNISDISQNGYEQRNKNREVGKASMDKKSYLTKIRESECYKKYCEKKEMRGLDFLDMLNAYSHTPPEELRRSMKLIETIAKDLSDTEIVEFLNWCRGMFDNYLKDEKKKKG